MEEIYDQAGFFAILYASMSEKQRKAFFGDLEDLAKEQSLTNYRMVILDLLEYAQTNNSSTSLPV